MGVQPIPPFQGTEGFTAYDRVGVDRFFVAAVERRAQLLVEMATARRRIADAEAALAGASDAEFRCIRMVLDGQRLLRDEVRVNEQAVADVKVAAEAEAERVLESARSRAAWLTASLDPDTRPGGHHKPHEMLDSRTGNGMSAGGAFGGTSVFT